MSRTSDFLLFPAPERESDLLRLAGERLRERLPSSWELQIEEQGVGSGRRRPDAVVRVTAPDGQQMAAVVEAKRLINTRDVPAVLDQVRTIAAELPGLENAVVLLIARYLAPATRERIVEAGAGYVDLTGNVQLASERPALLIRDRGADRDPWRGPGRPRGTLKGQPAARVVRALIDFTPPYTVPELAERAGASTGATYRVVDFLEEEGLLEPTALRADQRCPLAPVARALEPRLRLRATEHRRDLPRAPRAVRAHRSTREPAGARLRLTGSLAAERVAAYAPARLATLYVRDPAAAAELLELRPTETGANVALASGDYDVVFERAQMIDGVRVAAVSQVAVDLLTGPGRNPSEATALLDWMAANGPAWRR